MPASLSLRPITDRQAKNSLKNFRIVECRTVGALICLVRFTRGADEPVGPCEAQQSAADHAVEMEDSFCSPGTNRGCTFSHCRSLKIPLPRRFLSTPTRLTRPDQTSLALAGRADLEPFWRHPYSSKKVLP